LQASRRISKIAAGAPFEKAAPARLLVLSPPERLFGLTDDIAPRQSDIVQVAVGPMGQLISLLPAVDPEMKTLAEPGQKPRFMIICHFFRETQGHFVLLNITFQLKYVPNPGLRQTTLCAMIDDINS
jgi:hypothetical protein